MTKVILSYDIAPAVDFIFELQASLTLRSAYMWTTSDCLGTLSLAGSLSSDTCRLGQGDRLMHASATLRPGRVHLMPELPSLWRPYHSYRGAVHSPEERGHWWTVQSVCDNYISA